ncbi:hypothetical protein TrVGV298_004597 [Trichoderma virens]|nr:hypothetical protein TrVGV298_004597 [Trichoderma virens]
MPFFRDGKLASDDGSRNLNHLTVGDWRWMKHASQDAHIVMHNIRSINALFASSTAMLLNTPAPQDQKTR